MEAIREHEERTHARVLDRIAQALRSPEVGRERLLEEHRLAGLDRANREIRLRVRRDRDCDRVRRRDQRVDVFVRRDAERARDLPRVGRGT
jgi:hypothetical protein